jgi:DNA-binding beta-propeller fold protein YncE
MRRRSILCLSVATLVAFSCTTKKTGPTFPIGAQTVPTSFPTRSIAGLPAACSGQVYYEASTSLCPPALTYLLCDGQQYSEYDCQSPGAGWTQETLSQYDRTSTGPSECNGGGDGTVYVEGNVNAPGQNSILVFHYCNSTLPPLLVGRFLTGGSGAADLNDDGVLDADQQLLVDSTHTLLFAVNQGSDSIAVFHIAADGSLTPVNGSPFNSGGLAPSSVGIHGHILVVANKAYDGIRPLADKFGNYTTFTIASDGSLTPTGSTISLPSGADPTQAYVAPGGTMVFGTEETGFLRAMQLSSTGVLTNAPGTPVSLPLSFFATVDGGRPYTVWPAGLSASPTQPVLYMGVPNASKIATYEFDTSGVLTYTSGEADPNSYLPCWSILNADGSRLYVANAGSGNLSIWDTATDARNPKLLQTWGLQGGGNPWGLHFDPTGTLLFAITPRNVHAVPQDQGQLLHGLRVAGDGTITDEMAGSPVTLPIAPDTNAFGVAVVASVTSP